MKSGKAVNCPYCQRAKVVRNGVKKTSRMQNLLYRHCGKQFQSEYLYWAGDPDRRELIRKMLLRGSGVRDCAAVAGVSKESVRRLRISNALQIEIKPKYSRYPKVQIEERGSYRGKKKKKVWLI